MLNTFICDFAYIILFMCKLIYKTVVKADDQLIDFYLL